MGRKAERKSSRIHTQVARTHTHIYAFYTNQQLFCPFAKILKILIIHTTLNNLNSCWREKERERETSALFLVSLSLYIRIPAICRLFPLDFLLSHQVSRRIFHRFVQEKQFGSLSRLF